MELKETVERLKSDSKYFCETLLKIVYDGSVHDWKFLPSQEYINRAKEKQEKAGKPVRLIIPKSRREGVSTYIEGVMFQKVTTRSHRLGMIISHEQESAEEIAEITRRFWEFLPPDKRPSIPGAKLPSGKSMLFDKLKSKLLIETAMDLNTGRSMAIDYVHVSEIAFWRNAETLMLGLLQCISDKDLDTIIVIESTANGVGGYFYDMVYAAIAGENDYEMVFLPWFIDPRYQMPIDVNFKATEEEEHLRNLYVFDGKKITLTNEQLMWRRHTIKNKCNGDKIKFRQEYPGSIDEAFIYSGRTRFNQESLAEIQSKARKEIFRGFIHEEMLLGGKRKHTLEANERGYLTIYERPVHRAQYVLFADVSEGIEVKERDTDYSAIDVLRCDTLEQVAHWHGRIGPELLDNEITKLAWYYNEAFVGVEKNNIGYGVVAALKDTYGRLYINLVHDKNGKEITKEFGWRTTVKTKPLMINGLAEAINDGSILINNLASIEECRRYTIHPDGSLGAPSGQHDDRCISLSGAVQMYLHSYHAPESKDIERPDEDDDEEDEEN